MLDAHRGAFEYDWRARFPGVSRGLAAIGTDNMSWGEALRLTQILIADTGSQVSAAVADWPYPMDRTALVLADLYDLQHQSKSKKRVQPYPRPWIVPAKRKLSGTPMSVDALRALLDEHRSEGGAADG